MTDPTAIGGLVGAITSFAATTATTAHDLEADIARARLSDWAEASSLEPLAARVHRLAGTAATLGFADLGRIARALSHLLAGVLRTHAPPSPDTRDQASELAQALVARVATLTTADSVLADQDLAERSLAIREGAPMPGGTGLAAAPNDLADCTVLTLGVEQEVRQALEDAGFRPLDLEGLAPGSTNATGPLAPPCALVIDLGTAPDADLVARVGAWKAQGLPVLAVGGAGTFLWRVRAHRLGADSYLVHSDAGTLADSLRTLVADRRADPPRALILDDDPLLADLYATILIQAGIDARGLTRAEDILDQIARFDPDVLVTDLDMPTFSGIEVTAALRFGPRQATLPIVVLAPDRDQDHHSAALAAGADLLLTKPLQPDPLIAAVRDRARRARLVRDMTLRDCMTGLLNHTALFDQMQRDLTRAARTDGRVSFALIDLDGFKQVNDSHGHHVGDMVITTLARLLRRRLRRSDSAGRFGGEEFALILPGTPADQAQRLVQDLLVAFRDTPIAASGDALSITFSAGVAEWRPPPQSRAGARRSQSPAAALAQEVFNRADRALYSAKARGRNRVEVDTEGAGPETPGS